ncbi:MAG TPA: hypothetical protein VLL76_06540, partial [Candidatus Omnitrophota bacterium]|nr:hypothetical protein [Candidatus Omnitrophota bacterium]
GEPGTSHVLALVHDRLLGLVGRRHTDAEAFAETFDERVGPEGARDLLDVALLSLAELEAEQGQLMVA